MGGWSIDHQSLHLFLGGNLHALPCVPPIFYIAVHRLMLYNVARSSMGGDCVLICKNVNALPCVFMFTHNTDFA